MSPGALDSVAFSKELATEVKDGHGRCSAKTLAHDHAAGQGEHTFSLEEMKADLQQMMEADTKAKALAKA